MDDAARVLVLANRTADSPQLRQALLERREQGPIAVTLLVPAAWEAQDPHGGMETGGRRVRAALESLRDTGLEVQCRVGDADPVTALREAWDPDRYDEVIVSTLEPHVEVAADRPAAPGGADHRCAGAARRGGRGRRAQLSQPRTVRHECHVIRRISSEITRPMSGSARSRPSATTAALATTRG